MGLTGNQAYALSKQYTDEHGGGGGGTTNYNALSNRPSINGTTLSGNKTGAQLGLQQALTFDNTPTENSNNPVKSGGIYTALAQKVDKEVGKALSTNDFTTAEKNKLTGIEAGAEVNVIESIVLNGVVISPVNKAVNINVITRTVANLANYYLKTETYTKTEVDNLLSAMASLTLEIVEELPVSDISTTTIYLVPVSGQTNVYMQYAYINNDWAQLGTTQVDLTNYYTKTQVDTLLNGKEDTLTFDSAPTSASNNPVKSGGVYTALANKQDTLTFDLVPTENSNNPVKSGGIYDALRAKEDALTFDNAPTLGSSNPVTSDGIKQAIDNATPPTATEQSLGVVKPDGSTITIDNDGTIHGSSGISPDESDFTFEEGLLSLNSDRRFFTGTQAEWDELNSADKALYSVVNITDDDAVPNYEQYSLDEVKTNKIWIDGKPIYRKVVKYTTARSNNTDAQIGSVSGIDTCIKYDVFFEASNGIFAWAERYANTNDNMVIWLDNSSNSGKLMFRQNTPNNIYLESTLYAIVEYTKVD